MPGDVRLADHWDYAYSPALAPGLGNLSVLDSILLQFPDKNCPIIWVYTEPGRDFGRLTGRPQFDWMISEDIFAIRHDLDIQILETIKSKLDNPIAFIGGLSDVNVSLCEQFGFDVLHNSWQRWIAEKLQSQWFKFGWGASDIGWRANYNNIRPSRAATLAWDEQIKEWCWWQEQGWFCHEHPSPLANQEFAEFLKPAVHEWLLRHAR